MWNACTDERERCIVALMLGCGLRSVDVSRLRIEDISLDDQMMVVHGKGGHSDLVPIPSNVAAAIADYLRVHPATTGPLMRQAADLRQVRLRNTPMSAQLVQALIRRVIARTGIKDAPYDGRGSHALRRTFASTLLDNGATVREVQALLRHQSLSATERYLRRPEAHEMRALVEHSPLASVTRPAG